MDADPITGTTLPIPSCRCQSYELLGPDLTAASVQLAGATTFSTCRLRISSDHPVELRFDETSLEDVHIELSGPIALAMSEAQLIRVSIDANANAAGEPSLRLENSNADEFTLHASGVRPISKLDARYGTLTGALIEAEWVHLASVALRRSALLASDLDTSDATIEESRLDIDQGLLSASSLNTVSVPNCRQARFVEADISMSELSCSELLQLYSSHANGCVLDGRLEFDDVDLSGASLGLLRPTVLLSYLSRFDAVTFCEGTQSVLLSGGTATCAACLGQVATSEGQLCGDGMFSAQASEHLCPPLASLAYCDVPPSRRPR